MTSSPHAVPAAGQDLDQRLARIERLADLVLDGQHELRRLMLRLPVQVDVIDLHEAARRIGRSARTLEKLLARQVFSDPRGAKVRGSKRLLYADEIEAWRSEGEGGVRRLRTELGRL